MAIEILTVSLSDQSIELVARAVARMLSDQAAVTQSNPPSAQNPQGAEPSGFQPQADPWTNSAAPQEAYATTQQAPQAPVQQYQPPVQQQQQGAAPTCVHGPMRYVPGGFSQNSGKAYAAFWGCPTPRGTPNQCKSVPA